MSVTAPDNSVHPVAVKTGAPAFANTQEFATKYVLSRSYSDSIRLTTQHWLFGLIMGYQLHPQASQILSHPDNNSSSIYVADIGCGNGVWLLELSQKIPESQKPNVQLHAIDISDAYLPNLHDRPSTFVLSLFDPVNGEVPEELVGKFDIIHVRMFSGVIRNNNPGTLIENASKMLKSGGYLQWDELDLDNRETIPYPDGTECQGVREFVKAMDTVLHRVQKLDWRWIPNLDEFFRGSNFEVMAYDRFKSAPEFRKLLSDNMVMAGENIGYGATKANNQEGILPGTDRKFDDILHDAVRDLNQGAMINADIITCLGRKPAQPIST